MKKTKDGLLVLLVSFLLMEAVSFSSSGPTLYLPLITKPFSRSGFGVLETSPGTIVYQEGVALTTAQAVLIKVGSGTPFADAFQQVFGRTVDRLETEFIAYLISH